MNGGVNGWRRHVGNFAISCILLTLISNGRMARGQCALNCTTRELDWHAHQLQWCRCRLQLGLTFWSLLWLFLWKVQVEAMQNFCVFFTSSVSGGSTETLSLSLSLCLLLQRLLQKQITEVVTFSNHFHVENFLQSITARTLYLAAGTWGPV